MISIADILLPEDILLDLDVSSGKRAAGED